MWTVVVSQEPRPGVRAALRGMWHLMRGLRADQCCFPTVGASPGTGVRAVVGPGPGDRSQGCGGGQPPGDRSQGWPRPRPTWAEAGVKVVLLPGATSQSGRKEHAVHVLYFSLAGGYRWPPCVSPHPSPPRPGKFFTRGKQWSPQGGLRAHTALHLQQTQGCTEEVCGETGPGQGPRTWASLKAVSLLLGCWGRAPGVWGGGTGADC